MVHEIIVKKNVEKADCNACRLFGSAGLTGIGAYLANMSYKNKTLTGRLTVSTLALGFVSLGIARYRRAFPFNQKESYSS